jgi:hypothetical protein
MSRDAARADAPRPSLGNDVCAERLDEPGGWLYPLYWLGGDLHIANFGGGNFSPKVDAIKFYRYLQRSLDLFSKSAGNILNVDAGNAVAFAR